MAALAERGLATTYGHVEPPAGADVAPPCQPVLGLLGQDGTTMPPVPAGRREEPERRII